MRKSTIVILACSVLLCSGCGALRFITGQTVKSPTTGEYVTPEAAEAERDLIAKQKERESKELQAEAEVQKGTVIRSASRALAKLENEKSEQADEIREELNSQVGTIVSSLTNELRSRQAAMEDLNAKYKNAISDAAKQTEILGGALNIGTSLAQSSGIAPLAIGATILTGLFGLSKTRQAGRANAKADALTQLVHKANKAHAKTYDAARRIVDSIDVLQKAVPDVAKAIKNNENDIDQWQGTDGQELVDALQRNLPAPIVEITA